ncbi:MCE family protein [Rhodococcus hoagii]|uniref:MCE family protein n=1 Tax=Rhodococcus hoagii TaxID=43767 RepID=UPI0011AAD42F|nr:MlaD family protein [Prescottella equi]MBM4524669.1 MCE family protein [Prescottella equi]MBM4650475.1 MCE family protein [Prescottella equi]MBM4683573.1 MCE family protein [Prescottella equi]NKS37185.1 MCE family protein [Prescottella equi]
MMLSKFVKIQLVIFSILTVIGLVVMATQYVRLQDMAGIGRYKVTVELPSTGGLYRNANVTFRGTTVGKVEEVRLSDSGVEAVLNVDSAYDIPANVNADVRSVSAVGEQFVDLVPPEDSSSSNQLAGGDVIPVSRTSVPQDVGVMLDQADVLLASISDTRLRTVIDESFKAFNGSGPDLQRLIDSARLFVEEANKNSDATKTLIEQAGPLLDTQVVSSDAIRSWTKDLVTFTNQLRTSDRDLRAVIEKGPGAAQEANQLLQELQPTLPLLLANLVSVGEVGVIYNAGIEQILVLYPPLTAALATSAGGGNPNDGALVDFHLQLNDPPPCTTGFLPADQWRSPADESPADTPGDLFCKIDQSDPNAIRGARNLPCMEYPGRRAPTPEACRNGYVPLGTNPWQGPPQPVASTTDKPAVGPVSTGATTAARRYDPVTGTYIGPDGRTYSQPNLGGNASQSLEDLMKGQQGR